MLEKIRNGGLTSRLFIWASMVLASLQAAHATEMKPDGLKIRADSPGSIRFETCSRPEYPEQEFKEGRQGTVTMQFLIAVDGTVKRARVHTSSGSPALDKAALDGIAQCRFNPPMVDGKPVEGWTAIQYVWKP